MAVDMGSCETDLPTSPLAVHLADDLLFSRREVAVLQPRTEVVQPPRTATPAAPLQPFTLLKEDHP